MPQLEIRIATPAIGIGQFLKWAGIADTGGQSRFLIANGRVTVNGEIELRYGRRLVSGDRVRVDSDRDKEFLVVGGGEG